MNKQERYTERRTKARVDDYNKMCYEHGLLTIKLKVLDNKLHKADCLMHGIESTIKGLPHHPDDIKERREYYGV